MALAAARRAPAYLCSNPLCGYHSSSGGTCTQCGNAMAAQQ